MGQSLLNLLYPFDFIETSTERRETKLRKASAAASHFSVPTAGDILFKPHTYRVLYAVTYAHEHMSGGIATLTHTQILHMQRHKPTAMHSTYTKKREEEVKNKLFPMQDCGSNL